MTKTFITAIHRNVGHPYTGEPGWDVMYVKFKDEKVEGRFTDAAGDKGGWKLLITGWDDDPHCTGEPLPMCVYFKPTGRWDPKAMNWCDPSIWPYPQDWI